MEQKLTTISKVKKLTLILFPILFILGFTIFLYEKHTKEIAKYDFVVHNGKDKIALSSFRGKQVFVYFGYGLCPDICPTTLTALSESLNALSADEAANVEAIFITLDPQRDKPKEFAEFARYFHPKIIGATTSEEYVKKITSAYGASYKKINLPDSSIGYSVAHSADLYLLDKKGKLKEKLPFGVTPKEIVEAIRK